MALGKTDEAIASFEKAKAIENNDVVKNNLGFGSLVKGDVAKAEEYFNSMTAATPESKYGLGVIAITKGEYDKAVNDFGTEPCFNLALALYLKGDVAKAKSTLDSMKELCKCGKPSYLKAVIGAKLDDKNYMLSNLREAIGFKADWKLMQRQTLNLPSSSLMILLNLQFNNSKNKCIKRGLGKSPFLFYAFYLIPLLLLPRATLYTHLIN